MPTDKKQEAFNFYGSIGRRGYSSDTCQKLKFQFKTFKLIENVILLDHKYKSQGKIFVFLLSTDFLLLFSLKNSAFSEKKVRNPK